MKLLSRLTAALAIILFMATTASAQGATPTSPLITALLQGSALA